MKVDIWSDIVCPFCYIGKKRLEKIAKKLQISLEINWHPFELDPNYSASSEKLSDLISKKYNLTIQEAVSMLNQTSLSAATEGITFNWEKAKRGNTLMAHRLIHFAKSYNLADELSEAFFVAYMTNGEEIGQREVLEKIATSVGLSLEKTKEVLDENMFLDDIRDEESFAKSKLNIQSVPFFIFNDKIALSGAQPDELFEEALIKANTLF